MPLRQWYERWVGPLANMAAAEVIALQQYVENQGGSGMATSDEVVRTVRIESQLRFATTPEGDFRLQISD